MIEQENKLAIATLLRDVGRLSQPNQQGNESEKASTFLKANLPNSNDHKDIIEWVRYSDIKSLQGANIDDSSNSYIIGFADGVAYGMEREEKRQVTNKFAPLQSIFNILNNNKGKKFYSPRKLNELSEDDYSMINTPTDKKVDFTEKDFKNMLENIKATFKQFNYTNEYLSILLDSFENNLSYVPSTYSAEGLSDISLYDHAKTTAALAVCTKRYLEDNNIVNYKETLYDSEKEYLAKPMYMLGSLDISGIQSFIYTITTKNALKMLRSRSFYLEIVMEHIVDTILEKLNLTRTNVIYIGGGHCYMILPNTVATKENFKVATETINKWFLEKFQTSLFLGAGLTECTGNSLKNYPDGSYREMFKELTQEISIHKLSRYSASNIASLNADIYNNTSSKNDYSRECSVCKNIGKVNDEGRCPICEQITNFSGHILNDDYFIVVDDSNVDGLLLPNNYKLIGAKNITEFESICNTLSFVRAYGKNKAYAGKHKVTRLWTGCYNYKYKDEKNQLHSCTFEDYAKLAEGIERIAVLRADVDNLGQAFVRGFERKENKDKYVTLLRTSALSRQLSLFFKYHLNSILQKSDFKINGTSADKNRKATIVYSGGDDLFIVGAWNDVIELAIDVVNQFSEYTESTLSLSAGIGLYHHSYPISVIADETEEMVDESKNNTDKASITLLSDGCSHIENDNTIDDGTYHWNEFEEQVVGEKYAEINRFFSQTEDRGKALLYKLLELIRSQEDKINYARFLYLLARLEPTEKDVPKEQKESYKQFSKNMAKWILNPKDCRQLKTAITMYAYMTRERKEEN